MSFDSHRYHARLQSQWLGRSLCHFDLLDSTNRYLKAKAGELPLGTLIVADTQSAGYGQRGREWVSSEKGLYWSALFPPQAIQPTFTLMVGASLARTLRRLLGSDEIGVKWVNDIVCRGRKLGGILSEASQGNWLVLGVGLNLQPLDLPDAISLAELSFTQLAREELLAEITSDLEIAFERWLGGGGEALRNEWSHLAVMLGQEVCIQQADAELRGIAEGIDEEGRLVICTNAGQRVHVSAGTLRRADGRYC